MITPTRLTALLAGLTLDALAAPALAQARPEDNWSFTLGAATDNRSKNASKTDNEGHVFGSATWESDDGLFYAGPGFQGDRSAGGDVELLVSAGYAPEAFGYEFDVNVAYLNRVGADAAFDEDAWEITANMRRAIGPAWGNLQVQYSPDAAGPTRAFTWVEAELGWEFTRRLSGSAALGRREQIGAPDYTGWNAGLTWGLTDALDLDVRYHDTDAHGEGEAFREGVVAEVVYAF
jgi:uncharacterized protein (TIGR02001 family)